jgi:hypothetical protein
VTRPSRRTSGRWELAGELLLWLGPPTFVVFIALLDRLVRR